MVIIVVVRKEIKIRDAHDSRFGFLVDLLFLLSKIFVFSGR